jgi:hypothetical protein
MSTVEDVGLLALEDKGFFMALLEDPRGALEAKIGEGVFELEEEDILRVVELVQEGHRAVEASEGEVVDPGKIWEDLKAKFPDQKPWPTTW